MTDAIALDFRSDTVTRPTPEMMRAIAEAELGDAARGDDPTVIRLEARAAELVGKEAAIFVPSGTMGNIAAVLTHVSAGEEVIVEAGAHILNREGGAISALAGALPRPLIAPVGVLDPDAVTAAIRTGPKDNVPRTGLISVENTHNAAGGTVTPVETMRSLFETASDAGVPLHLDGARVFNAAVALGCEAGEICRHATSVMFCLSKGLSAPVGSILAGDQAFIARARRKVRMLGGGMRQAGLLAAAGLVALADPYTQPRRDHETARALARGFAKLDPRLVDPADVETNIINCRLDHIGHAAEPFMAELARQRIRVDRSGSVARFVTHRHIDERSVETCLAAVASAMDAGSA